MVDRRGGVTEGRTTFPAEDVFVTEATRTAPDGSSSRHRDTNLLASETVHRNETFSWTDGAWVSGGIYEWTRVPAGPPGTR